MTTTPAPNTTSPSDLILTGPTTAAAREQFAHQAPYYPGTHWLVDGQPRMIDSTGRVCTVDGRRLVMAWWRDGCEHVVEPLRLVREGEPSALAEAVAALADARPAGGDVVRLTVSPIPGVGIGEMTATYVSQAALRRVLAAHAPTEGRGTYEYVLTIPEHGMVGIGPTTDREAVRTDYHDWLDETGKHGTIMRRPVADWDMDPEQEYEQATPRPGGSDRG